MQARGPLMIEHRLIERMIAIIKRTLSQIEKEEKIDPVFMTQQLTLFEFMLTEHITGKRRIFFSEISRQKRCPKEIDA